MIRDTVGDLVAFIAVAREGSFTRAAVQLGVSQPALSHTLRSLEARLGVRLLNRTTRSVAPTEAGERLLRSIEPQFAQIEGSLTALTRVQGQALRPCPHHLDPTRGRNSALAAAFGLMRGYPEITVELVTDEGLTNIVSERFDAGVRVGEFVEKDMIAVRIGPEMRQAIVGTPDYFKTHPVPKVPKTSPITAASICGASRGEATSPGSSRSGAVKSTCAWKVSLRSTVWNWHAVPRWTGSGWLTCPRT